jgi:RHS repeat-associated protein
MRKRAPARAAQRARGRTPAAPTTGEHQHTRHLYKVTAAGRQVAQVERLERTGVLVQDDRRYIHGDHLGSSQVITDEDGNLKHVQRFDPFGAPIDPEVDPTAKSGDAATKNIRRGFTGHETDVETGLVNMGGRIYDPRVGRFMQADPILQPGWSQTLNRYSYVANNPLNAVDPTGFFEDDDEDDPDDRTPDEGGTAPANPANTADIPSGAAAGASIHEAIHGETSIRGSDGDMLVAEGPVDKPSGPSVVDMFKGLWNSIFGSSETKTDASQASPSKAPVAAPASGMAKPAASPPPAPTPQPQNASANAAKNTSAPPPQSAPRGSEASSGERAQSEGGGEEYAPFLTHGDYPGSSYVQSHHAINDLNTAQTVTTVTAGAALVVAGGWIVLTEAGLTSGAAVFTGAASSPTAVTLTTAGTATVFKYAGNPAHTSVLVQTGNQAMHTNQQVLAGNLTTVAPYTGTAIPVQSVQIGLPNAVNAINYQLSVIGTPTGLYNPQLNSCVTHCGAVISAGGVEGVPATTTGIAAWLMRF